MEEETGQLNILDKIPGEVFCLFKSNLPERYKIDEDQPVNIQTSLNEKNLSEVIISMLREQNSDEEYPDDLRFEFMINSNFIRGNLKSHIVQHNISTEETLTIYYYFALKKPFLKQKNNEDDWISTISALYGIVEEERNYLVSLFNGSVSLYNSKNEKLLTNNLTSAAIKCMDNAPGAEEDSYNVILGCSDEILRVCNLNMA